MADDGDDGLVVAGTEPRKYTHCHHQLSWSQLMDRPTDRPSLTRLRYIPWGLGNVIVCQREQRVW